MSDAATRGFVRGSARDRGFEQVARFLLLIGAERSAPVLAHLTEREVVCIAREVAALGSIEPRERRRTMEDFGYPVPPGSATTGGAAAAHRLLRAAFAEERATALLQTALDYADSEPSVVTPAPPASSSAVHTALQDADSEPSVVTPAPPASSSAVQTALQDEENAATTPPAESAPQTGTREP